MPLCFVKSWMWASKVKVNLNRRMLQEARIKKPKMSDQIVKYVVGEVAREFVAAVSAANHCANILIKYNQNG